VELAATQGTVKKVAHKTTEKMKTHLTIEIDKNIVQ
jgi:hypothetical protein